MLTNIKNIVFDIGGVLMDLDRDRCVEAFSEIGFVQASELIDLYHPAEFFNKLERGQITGHECCDIIREVAGNPAITDEQIRDAYAAFLIGIPVKKLRLMKSLRDKGYKVYALSNINEILMPRIFECFEADGLKASDYFDYMYLSYEMKMLKPDREIFEELISHSGVVPSETFFLDDSERNANMGREVGFEVYMPAPCEDYSFLFDEVLK